MIFSHHHILTIPYQVGQSSLIGAAKGGHLKIVKLLLKSGANINAGDIVSCQFVRLFL